MAVVGLVCIALVLAQAVLVAEARIPGVYSGGAWQSAHATFYGGSDASGTMSTFPHLAAILLAPVLYGKHELVRCVYPTTYCYDTKISTISCCLCNVWHVSYFLQNIPCNLKFMYIREVPLLYMHNFVRKMLWSQ